MSTDLIVFWSAAGILLYIHIGYPCILYLMERLHSRPWKRDRNYLPSVSIVVVACNEARNVSDRILNLLALDYPRDKLQIIIASDGSTDDTVERARRFASSGIRVVEYVTRSGKPATLNRVVPLASGEIVVLADMRQRFDKSALKALVAPFADRLVGAVTGELLLTGTDGGSAGEGVGFYWKYEKFIRLRESLIDSTVGVTGAIYAIRRELYRRIQTDTLLDDVLIPMQITRQGYRVIYEPAARARDDLRISTAREFTRKVRTISGNFQLLMREPWLISPARNRLWFQTLSHKFFRLLSPFCLLAVFVVNLQLLHVSFYQGLFAAQLIFYGGALAGCWNEFSPRKIPLVNVPYAFCLLNWATVMALFSYLTGRQSVTWKISHR